jgi:hypothetical protein
MTAISLSTKQKYGTLLAGNPAGGNSSYWLISRITVGSTGSSSITFSSIPQTYTHLQLRAFWCNTIAGNLKINFNSDTGANYKVHYLYGDGATASAAVGAVSPNAMTLGYSSSTGTYFETSICDVLDYTNTNKNKTIRNLGGNDRNGGGDMELDSGLWMSTSAVTSITLTPQAGTVSQYSSVALYGIKGA